MTRMKKLALCLVVWVAGAASLAQATASDRCEGFFGPFGLFFEAQQAAQIPVAKIVEAYERLLTGSDPIDAAELKLVLERREPFSLGDNGPSQRRHVLEALKTLKRLVSERPDRAEVEAALLSWLETRVGGASRVSEERARVREVCESTSLCARPVDSFPGPAAKVDMVEFAAEGGAMVLRLKPRNAGGKPDPLYRAFHLFDAKTWAPVRAIPKKKGFPVAISSDGRWALFDSQSKLHSAALDLIDLRTGKVKATHRAPGGGPEALSPDGKFVALFDVENSVLRLWNERTGKQHEISLEEDTQIQAMSFARDKRVLRWVTDKEAVVELDLKTRRQRVILAPHEMNFPWLARLFHDGSLLARLDGTELTVHDLAAGTVLAKLQVPVDEAHDVFISPDRKLLFWASYEKRDLPAGVERWAKFRVYELETGEFIDGFQLPDLSAGASMTWDGRTVIFSHYQHILRRWDLSAFWTRLGIKR